jgi:hypothetical protein
VLLPCLELEPYFDKYIIIYGHGPSSHPHMPALHHYGSIPAQLISFYTYNPHAFTFPSTDPWSGKGRVNDWRRFAAPIVCPGP